MFASRWPVTNLGGMSDGANGLVTGNEMSGFSNGTSTLGDIDWQDVINQSFAVGSQAISAFSGQHGGVQVGINPQGGIFAITPTQPVYDEASLYARGGIPAGLSPAQVAAYNAQRGGVAEDALGSVSSFVAQHPLMVFGGIAALFLLYREPPRRR